MPFDFSKRSMNGDQPVARHDVGQQNGHSSAVLATTDRDRDEGAGSDRLPALGEKAHAGNVDGYGSVFRMAER